VDELLAIAQRQSDPALLLEAHHAAWNTNFNLAKLVSSRDHTEQGRRLYEPHEHRSHKFLYGGHDPGVCSRSYGGMALCLLGYPDRASESANGAVALAEELAHRDSLANALCLGAFTHQFRRDLSRCGECADAAVTLCREPELPTWLALATQLRGYSLAAQGQAREGIGQMRQALAAVSAIGREVYAPYFRALLAEALGQVGQAEDGLDLLDEALAFIDKTGERFWEAEVHRLKGALLLTRSKKNRAAADAAFNQAITIARRQEAKLLELRATTSLARLWGERNKRAQAQALLAPVYGWFTEGFDTADLKEGKVLLDELK
jgi:predicted ATPase